MLWREPLAPIECGADCVCVHKGLFPIVNSFERSIRLTAISQYISQTRSKMFVLAYFFVVLDGPTE